MTVETEDFDHGAVSSRGPQDIRTEVSTPRGYAGPYSTPT